MNPYSADKLRPQPGRSGEGDLRVGGERPPVRTPPDPADPFDRLERLLRSADVGLISRESIAARMDQARIHPAIIYVYLKTGLLYRTDTLAGATTENLVAWWSAAYAWQRATGGTAPLCWITDAEHRRMAERQPDEDPADPVTERSMIEAWRRERIDDPQRSPPVGEKAASSIVRRLDGPERV